MLYETLVSRVSELSRTLVQSGTQGEFEQGGSVFRTGCDLAGNVRSGFYLRLLGASAPGTYRVVALTHAGEIEIDHVFEVRGRGVEWEIYDEGVDGAAVKRVLHVFPDAVMECEEGGQVRTPFGVFRIVRRRRKRVRCPSGLWTHAAERIQARIRPGKRLQRQVPEGPSEPLAEDIPISAPDEDPES